MPCPRALSEIAVHQSMLREPDRRGRPMTSSPPEIDRHPRKAFFALFFIEIWERFGYYGIASLMVLYMVEHLGLGDARADIIWGAFSALAYSMPMLGGYIGDRVLGARRTLVLGAVTLGLGYLLLSVPLNETLFPALGLIPWAMGCSRSIRTTWYPDCMKVSIPSSTSCSPSTTCRSISALSSLSSSLRGSRIIPPG